jgi:DNA-binding PadR family transcriptional regulator
MFTMKNSYRRSPLALAVLALLYEEPMHPYRMQRLIKERGKDEVVNVRDRASVYQTIDRLVRAGLVSPRETVREEGRPDRTVYEITDEGRRATQEWMREMLSEPKREFPEFPVAIAYLPLLPPEDATRQLEERVVALERELARIDSELDRYRDALPRLFLLEMEYLRAALDTELSWVRALVGDLRAGRVTWSEEWMRDVAASLKGGRTMA